jgi:S-sulfosulfanyl-L-cysteine sulfohydrolase
MICRVENVNNPKLLDMTLHKIIREYLAAHSPVAPKVEGRVTATDELPTLLTQLEGYDYEFR